MKKYPIVKKAYQIDLSKIEEGYLYSEKFCYAENRSKAKSALISEIQYEDWALKFSDEQLNFVTIPVIRYQEADVLLFEEKEMSLYQILDLLKKRERDEWLDSILNSENVEYCYIMKRGQYYKPNSCGYTDYKVYAGVYSKEEAVSDAKSVSELNIVPINILEHNIMVQEQIEGLKKRIINTL